MSLAVLPFLLIPYDSLTHIFGLDAGKVSQTFPATAIFSLAYLLMRKGRLKITPTGRSVMHLLVASSACIGVVTLLNVIAEACGWLHGDVHLRVYAGSRQALSLALGLSTFLMFHDAILRTGMQAACRAIVLGAIPSLLLCLAQYLQGKPRIQGLSSEPSHLGDLLVLAFLPACIYAGFSIRTRIAVLGSGTFALLAAFSGTALMKALFELFSFFAVRGNLIWGAIVAIVAATSAWGILSLYPDNYVFHLWDLFQSFLDSGTLIGGSFIDRFFGFVGPLTLLDRPAGWLGLGLGGDSVYFYSLFDPVTAEAVLSQKISLPQISSHQGKMLLYGGLLGLTLYLAAWWVAWRAAPARHPARFLIPTVFAASLFSLGPFFLPYIWLWLAFGSAARHNLPAPMQAVINSGSIGARTALPSVNAI